MKNNQAKLIIRKTSDLLLLLSLFTMILSFYIGVLIFGQKDESILENKQLQKIPAFHFSSFFNGTYQEQLEASLIDQMPFSENIKGFVSKKQASLVQQMQSPFLAFLQEETPQEELPKQEDTKQEDTKQEDTKQEVEVVRNIPYIPISHDVYYYGDSPYMVFKYRTLTDKRKKKIKQMASQYNQAFKDVDSYFYFVNQSKSINFNTVSNKENEFLTYIKKEFHFKDIDGLKIQSFEQYKDYFYETDHHWNYKGSYQGYKDIIQMILPQDQLLEPIKEKTYDVYYYGSNARTTSIYSNKEKFTVYQFDLPKYTTYINGVKSVYGNKKMYENNQYYTNEGYNHYRAYYGGDFAEVIYDFHQPEKENLLIIAPSYSNANNDLIASHFNKTFVIDLRHYKNEFGHTFNAQKYCQENHIDKFVLMLSVDHLTNGNFLLEGE